MHIEFTDEAVWVGERSSVFFRAKVDGKTVKCFISSQALDDHFGGDDAQNYVPIVNSHWKEIRAVAERMIQAGYVSPASELILATNIFH